jgi:hypothetical protein
MQFGNPSTIVWRKVANFINALKRTIMRWIAHISIKIRECFPTSTVTNAFGSVAMIFGILGVIAGVPHPEPPLINDGMFFPSSMPMYNEMVLPNPSFQAFPPKTATTLSGTASQRTFPCRLDATTIADAVPELVPVFIAVRNPLRYKATETLLSDVNILHSNFYEYSE